MVIAFKIQPLLAELNKTNVRSLVKNVKNESKILRDWNELIKELGKISGKLAKGEDFVSISHDLEKIKVLGQRLGTSAAELGSMVPGPIGIVCSLALAIGCLIPPMDLVGLVLNLLGCIPFAKVGTKALKPIINDIIREILKNPAVKSTLKAGTNFTKKTLEYNAEYAKSAYRRLFLDTQKKVPPLKTGTNPESIINKQVGSVYTINTKALNIGSRQPISLNRQNYILSTNTGKPSPLRPY